jgi:hypothetical protein
MVEAEDVSQWRLELEGKTSQMSQCDFETVHVTYPQKCAKKDVYGRVWNTMLSINSEFIYGSSINQSDLQMNF